MCTVALLFVLSWRLGPMMAAVIVVRSTVPWTFRQASTDCASAPKAAQASETLFHAAPSLGGHAGRCHYSSCAHTPGIDAVSFANA